MGDVTSDIIKKEMKRKVKLHLKEGVIVIMKLTRGSAKFNRSRNNNRRVGLRRISSKTFLDVAKHPRKY